MKTNKEMNTQDVFNIINKKSKYKKYFLEDLKRLTFNAPLKLVKWLFIILTLGVGLIILIVISGLFGGSGSKTPTQDEYIRRADYESEYWKRKYEKASGNEGFFSGIWW